MNKMVKGISILAVGIFMSACAEEVVETDPTVPQVTTLSKKALVVGEPLSIYGHNFLDADVGATKLVFEGTFAATDIDGNIVPEKVAPFTIAPLYDGMYETAGTEDGIPMAPGTTILRWNRFGPFQVPFGSSGNKTGRFTGSVTPENHFADGTVVRGVAAPLTVDILPSVIIKRLEPIIGFPAGGGIETANCGSPALRGIHGMPYVIEVEAIGFRPKYFKYQVFGIQGPDDGREITHPVNGTQIDTLGDPTLWPDDGPIVLDKLSDGVGFDIAAIRVTAIDENNNAYYTALPLSVVRPLGFNYDGNRELAEYYEPVAVNGPIVGGIGSELSYSESESESRQQGVSMTVTTSTVNSQGKVNSESFSEGVTASETTSKSNSQGQSHTETTSSSESYGTTYNSSESNSSEISTKDGANWGWNTVSGTTEEDYNTKMGEVFGSVNTEVSASVTGEGGVPGIGKVSGTVGSKVGAEVGAKTGNTVGEKTATKNESGNHMYESSEKGTAFGSTTTDGKSESVSGTYGLSNQSTINSNTTESEAKTNSVSFEMGKTASVSEEVQEGKAEAWTESWVNTTTNTTLVNYKAKVPRGRCAVIYRQTIRHVRTAQMYNYDLCGVRSLLGEMTFNEWSWAPNIAVGNDCERELPPSTQPEAACFLACE